MLESIKDRNILVFGDLMLDEFVYGTVKRISPEAPVPVLEFINRESRLGVQLMQLLMSERWVVIQASSAVSVMTPGGSFCYPWSKNKALPAMALLLIKNDQQQRKQELLPTTNMLSGLIMNRQIPYPQQSRI